MTAVAGYYVIPTSESSLVSAADKFFPDDCGNVPTTLIFYCGDQADVELLFKTIGPEAAAGCMVVHGEAAMPAATASVFGITFGESADPMDSCVIIESKKESDDDSDDEHDN